MPTGFHNVLFPTRLAYGATGGPELKVDIVQLASGFERRNARTAVPKRRYSISAGLRPINEMRALVAFFESRGGPLNGFRFYDPVEHSTAEANNGVSATDVEIGTGDGLQRSFSLTLSHGRIIRAPRIDTIVVASDALSIQSGYEFDFDQGKLVFETPPSSGVKLTAGFEFDVPVRFENEQLLITNTADGAGEVSEISLVEILI